MQPIANYALTKSPRAYFTCDPGLRRKALNSVLVFILYLHKNILFFLDQSPATSQSQHEPHCVLLCPLQHLLPRDSPMANSRRSSHCIPGKLCILPPRRSLHIIRISSLLIPTRWWHSWEKGTVPFPGNDKPDRRAKREIKQKATSQDVAFMRRMDFKDFSLIHCFLICKNT